MIKGSKICNANIKYDDLFATDGRIPSTPKDMLLQLITSLEGLEDRKLSLDFET